MIDRSFVEKIEEMTVPASLHFQGMDFSDKKLFRIDPAKAAPLVVSSLSAIEFYCLTQLDTSCHHIVHIQSPERVNVLSVLGAGYQDRDMYVYAQCIYEPFRFDTSHSVEQFIIKMQAQFVQDETTDRILALVGNITSEAKQTTEDDGVTQRITAKSGIARVAEREVPNPVVLRPFRTFIEVEQPASKFILRLNAAGPPTCALYEADGGAWKNEAISNIAARLSGSLREMIEKEQITVLA